MYFFPSITFFSNFIFIRVISNHFVLLFPAWTWCCSQLNHAKYKTCDRSNFYSSSMSSTERESFFFKSVHQNSIDQRVKNTENKLTTYKRRISKYWRWWIRLWHFVKVATFSKISHILKCCTHTHICMYIYTYVHANVWALHCHRIWL